MTPHVRAVRFLLDRYPARDVYPFTLPVLSATRSIDLSAPVTMFVGENGSGKSTVLEAITRRAGIHIWANPPPSLERNPLRDRLHEMIELEWTGKRVVGSFFSSRIFQEFAQALDGFAQNDPGQLSYFGGRSLVSQSHGESLMSFFRARYAIEGLYLLDEPETALSPRTQLALVHLVHEMAGKGHAQFIVCTHSPILMACPGARLYSFDASPVVPIAYEATEHYRVYKAFMQDPRGHLPGGES
jgi:predicted ATPase